MSSNLKAGNQMSVDESAGWRSRLARASMALLILETISGLLITFAPFGSFVQWSLLTHTAIGVAALLPLLWYMASHWFDYRGYRLNYISLLGYAGLISLTICLLSGAVLTWQGLFGVRMTPAWRQVHLVSTFAVLATALPHLLVLLPKLWRRGLWRPAAAMLGAAAVVTAVGLVGTAGLTRLYPGIEYVNEFPEDYSYLYGPERPFAPSLARTRSGGAYDGRSLAGSETCGTSGCHEQIVAEWTPSAHRYAAMDTLFQGIQKVMAEQNGPESTRYCGGCHDPISLFSGTKNIFVEDLTQLDGFHEGVSCLGCHGIQETDLRGNANYVIEQHSEYLWQWKTSGAARIARDFLIRTYPDHHNQLSRRLFKAPEYCGACHKQFIDEEVNKVGWVQLQNQYDNWAASHWNVEGNPAKSVECRECHMPLVQSTDPAAGDGTDHNRTPGDGKHRSHRFAASNALMPRMLKLEGWETQVEQIKDWMEGRAKIPEIADKWPDGPIVDLELQVPSAVSAGENLPVRVIFTSRKVGHDYPTGPLDIIQSWLELRVTDEKGDVIFTSGLRDEKNFIEPGSFLFKAEPVDQFGNLIDRHNLWEMVGVRFRRALFPGFSDSVEFNVECPGSVVEAENLAGKVVMDKGDGSFSQSISVPAPQAPGSYTVSARLLYRKVDQFLLNFLLGEDSGITSPVMEVDKTTASVRVVPL